MGALIHLSGVRLVCTKKLSKNRLIFLIYIYTHTTDLLYVYIYTHAWHHNRERIHFLTKQRNSKQKKHKEGQERAN